MKHKTITTDKVTLLLVETENIDKNEDGHWLPNNEGGYMNIPFDQYQLLGRLPDITEEQAGQIVDEYTYSKGETEGFFDYENDSQTDCPIESLNSLLYANYVYFENPLGVRYTKGWDAETDYRSFLNWQEAQSKVWNKERCYLFIKVD